MKRIYGPQRGKATADWRKLHSEELHYLYASLNIISDQIKEDEIGWTCSMSRSDICQIGEEETTSKVCAHMGG